MLYGTVAIKSNTENPDELLDVKCQTQRTIREMFMYRSFEIVNEIEEATFLYFDQDEELECGASNSNQNDGLLFPNQQLTNDADSFGEEESSDGNFFTSAALVGLSFLGGTLIAAVFVGMHYKRTQRNTRRNVSFTEEDFNVILADV